MLKGSLTSGCIDGVSNVFKLVTTYPLELEITESERLYDPIHFKKLCDALSRNTFLKKLQFSCINLAGYRVSLLIEALYKNNCLDCLILEGCHLQNNDFASLFDAMMHNRPEKKFIIASTGFRRMEIK